MKRILLYLLFVFACLSSCTSSCEIGHQVTVHDMLRLTPHTTLHQWGIRHDGVHLRDCIHCHGNPMVKARWREHWPLQHDNKQSHLQLNDLRGKEDFTLNARYKYRELNFSTAGENLCRRHPLLKKFLNSATFTFSSSHSSQCTFVCKIPFV